MDAARQPSRLVHFDHLRLEDPQVLATAAQGLHEREQRGVQERRPGTHGMRHSHQPRRQPMDLGSDAARAQHPPPQQQVPRPERQPGLA